MHARTHACTHTHTHTRARTRTSSPLYDAFMSEFLLDAKPTCVLDSLPEKDTQTKTGLFSVRFGAENTKRRSCITPYAGPFTDGFLPTRSSHRLVKS